MTRARTKLTVGLLALLVLFGAYQGVTYNSQQVTNPRRIDRALGDDDSRQVVVQAWWSPGSTTANMHWSIGTYAQGSKLVVGATPRLPFERRGRVKRGEVVTLGWAMPPGPFAYIRWRMWLSGQVVKEGESKSPVMAVHEVVWA